MTTPAIEALRSIIAVLMEDIADENDSWVELLKRREELVPAFYKAHSELDELLAPENPDHARIFRIPFASAKMYYQVKDGPLYFCPDIKVETIGALSFVKDNFLNLTNGDDGTSIVTKKFRVVTESPACTEIAMCDEEEDGFVLEIDIARAICSTFHQLPDGFVPSFDVVTEEGSRPSFMRSSWKAN